MARRTGRSDMPSDPARTVRALRACRAAMIEVSAGVKPMGPAYHGAAMVISAIDGFAAFLTGERYYFSDIGSGATEGQAATDREKMKSERGEAQWRTDDDPIR